MKKQHSYRPKFVRVPEEMRRFAVLLEEEIERWPDVSVKPMFGMRALYRGQTIFGLLPERKMIKKPNAIAYKFAEKTPAKRKGHQWQIFDIEDEGSLTRALQILQEAHRKATIRHI